MKTSLLVSVALVVLMTVVLTVAVTARPTHPKLKSIRRTNIKTDQACLDACAKTWDPSICDDSGDVQRCLANLPYYLQQCDQACGSKSPSANHTTPIKAVRSDDSGNCQADCTSTDSSVCDDSSDPSQCLDNLEAEQQACSDACPPDWSPPTNPTMRMFLQKKKFIHRCTNAQLKTDQACLDACAKTWDPSICDDSGDVQRCLDNLPYYLQQCDQACGSGKKSRSVNSN